MGTDASPCALGLGARWSTVGNARRASPLLDAFICGARSSRCDLSSQPYEGGAALPFARHARGSGKAVPGTKGKLHHQRPMAYAADSEAARRSALGSIGGGEFASVLRVSRNSSNVRGWDHAWSNGQV